MEWSDQTITVCQMDLKHLQQLLVSTNTTTIVQNKKLFHVLYPPLRLELQKLALQAKKIREEENNHIDIDSCLTTTKKKKIYFMLC